MQGLYISRKSTAGLYRARVLQVDREKMRVRVYIPAFASDDDPSKEDPELLEANDNKDSNEETVEDTQKKADSENQESETSSETDIMALDNDEETNADPNTDKPPEEDSPESEDKEKSDKDEKSEEQKRWEEEHYKKYPWADASGINFMDKSLEPTFGRMFALCGEESEDEIPVLLPNKGDIVWIGFEGGDVGRAVYIGNLGTDMATKGATWIKDMRSKYASWANSLTSGGPSGGIGLGSAEQARKAIEWGRTLIGKVTYSMPNRQFRAENPTVLDCSSFVHWCYMKAGVEIADGNTCYTGSIAKKGEDVASGTHEEVQGKISQFLPGDLVITSNNASMPAGGAAHVMMITDNQGTVIHCSGSRGVHEGEKWDYPGYKYYVVRRICPATSSVDIQTDGTTEGNEKAIFEFCKTNLGCNTAAACGIIANIKQESGFKTDLTGDHGTSYGICQWHDTSPGKGRYTNLKNHAGSGYNTLSGQLSFLQSELTSGYSGMMSRIKSVSDNAQGAYTAAGYWCKEFERPANPEQRAAERGNYAKSYYDKYKNS